MTQLFDQKLFEQFKMRQSKFMLPHILILSFFLFLNIDLYSLMPIRFLPYGFVLVSLYARCFLMNKFFKDFLIHGSVVRVVYLIFTSLTTLSWGMIYWDLQQTYGFFHVNTLMCLSMVIIFSAGSITVFSGWLTSAIVFNVSVSIIPVVLLIGNGPDTGLLGYLLIVNFIYQTYHAYITTKYLKISLANEVAAIGQKDILQEYINALPGIVGVIDESETYIMLNDFLDGEIKKKILGTKVGKTLEGNPISKLILDFMKSPETHLIREIYSPDLTGENWYMVNLKKVTSPQRSVIASILPITELVKAKNELKIQEARSQYAAKLVSLGEFSASIAHEVNNPLTIISGAAHCLKASLNDGVLDPLALNQLSDKIIITSERIGKIIRSLKILSGDADNEPFRNVSFSSILEPTLEITKQKMKANNIELTIEGTEDMTTIFGNEVQLSQVILNLTSNAFDAVRHHDQKKVMISYRPSLEWIDIEICDTGIGVPDEIKDKIMDPFFTTKADGQGTGLGLSISKSIIERHQGNLFLMNQKDPTLFRIRFPKMS